MFRVAHLTDLHLGPLPRVRIRQLFGKRMLGYVGWLRGRRRRHTTAALDAIVADIKARKVDHTVITGDLVNIALPGEFEAAAVWLRQFGPPAAVSVIPGNHDAYVASAVGGWQAWAAYMSDSPDATEVALPFVRRAGPLAIIGLSTAVPTPLGFASGLLGQKQLRLFAERLAATRHEEGLRVILVHHPPIEGWSKPRKSLRDAARLRAVVKEHGADLMLCGHEHRLIIGAVDGPAGEIPVFCAPSASLNAPHGRRSGGYMLYTFERMRDGWQILAEHRAADPLTGRVETRLQSRLERPARAHLRRREVA